MKKWGGIALALMLGGCATLVPSSGPAPNSGGIPARPPARQPTPATPIAPVSNTTAVSGAATAVAAGLAAGPPVSSLPFSNDDAARALDAFRLSCPSLQTRPDASGLTRGSDWAAACAAAQTTSGGNAKAFFNRYFETVQVGDGKLFATGYYEPEIRASLHRHGIYQTPIYGRPGDLIDVDLGQFSDSLQGKHIRGRVQGDDLVPYYDRTQIEEGALSGRNLEIAWAADPVEAFFLQIQGSGRLRLPDGKVMRVGYAGQNGRSYTSIGKLMRERGLLAPGQASMQGMVAWLHAHPAEGKQLLRENKSFVFFRVLKGAGPLGALGLPVTPRGSVAADPHFIPLGAPVFLSADRTDATGLWVAQDTGGAIKGANRFDTYWGAGADARAIAGGMSAHGTAFILLPRGTLARLQADGPATP
ncbi:murein transglycosylase A [Stakelama sediminis]|uniref:peptidoglycan lytic exotransglycosylase n=1 Tax=Stakelama sediminis TaxID=463200 RepID=A0A840YUU3_9SPHN|nr:murein transglycosylase A [Stakelama sediminis]MBB5717295.1 membrane-bound lytic murein transglycosylase A [Stakelama sediminis]